MAKYCMDCKHFDSSSVRCKRPDGLIEDLVFGDITKLCLDAYSERLDYPDGQSCGTAGKYWEQK